MRFLVLLPRYALRYHKDRFLSFQPRNQFVLELTRKAFSHQHRYVSISSVILQDKNTEAQNNSEPKNEAEKKVEPTHVKGINLFPISYTMPIDFFFPKLYQSQKERS